MSHLNIKTKEKSHLNIKIFSILGNVEKNKRFAQAHLNVKKNKRFAQTLKNLVQLRALSIPRAYFKKTALTLRDVEKVELVKSNAIYKSRNIIISAVVELNCLTSNESPVEILSNCIETDLLNGKDTKDYTYEDCIIAVGFACKVLNESEMNFQAKTMILIGIKKKYPHYNFNAFDAFNHVYNYYHQTITSKKLWNCLAGGYQPLDKFRNNVCTRVPGLPGEMVVNILTQTMPLNYLIARVPLDQLLKVVTRLGINRKLQFEALTKMRECAHLKDDKISQADGQKYFKLQYGATPDKQYEAIFAEFGKSPLEVLADKNIEKAFVNQAFIDLLDRIEGLDQTTTDLLFFNKNLLRLPRNIGRLTALENLDLSLNHLTSLPIEIGNLSNLTTLSLLKNQIISLPSEIGNLINLTFLSLRENNLTSLPKEIGKCTGLTTLKLDKNQLSSLPIEIGKCTALKSLYLSQNKFTSLSKEIGGLSKLETLNLDENQIANLPDGFFKKLKALTLLQLAHNQLTTLPIEIGECTALQELDIRDNPFKSLPDNIFEPLQNLRYIYVSKSMEIKNTSIHPGARVRLG